MILPLALAVWMFLFVIALSLCRGAQRADRAAITTNHEPDLGPFIESTRAFAEVSRADQLVVLESTTNTGTTGERVVAILEGVGRSVRR